MAGWGQVENGLDWGQHGVRRLLRSFFFFFLVIDFLINFYWSIVALQHCLNSAVEQSESAVRIHVPPLFLDFLPI